MWSAGWLACFRILEKRQQALNAWTSGSITGPWQRDGHRTWDILKNYISIEQSTAGRDEPQGRVKHKSEMHRNRQLGSVRETYRTNSLLEKVAMERCNTEDSDKQEDVAIELNMF